jgi:thiol-disulfide isomerase/thioredoxin
MPVLLLRDRCDNRAYCFAATVCPNQAIVYSEEQESVLVFPERCGECRGPCLNFCDGYALKYAPSLEELALLQAELDGTMSSEQISQERLRLQKEAEKKRRRELLTQVTEASFEQEVLASNLPVLVRVQSSDEEDPVLQELAQQYLGQLLFRWIDASSERQLVAALRIRNLPTYLLFYQGQLVDGVSGVPAFSQLQGWIAGLLDQIRDLEQSPDLGKGGDLRKRGSRNSA